MFDFCFNWKTYCFISFQNKIHSDIWFSFNFKIKYIQNMAENGRAIQNQF